METRTRKKRQIAANSNRWENNTVFYYFDGSITSRNQAYIRKVLKYLSARTCIDFVENPTAKNRVMVFDGAGCYSSVGMDGGVQALSLTDDCMVVGTVAHEFMHALGALHMHMRDDRDKYVKINLGSVPVRLSSQLLLLIRRTFSYSCGTAYLRHNRDPARLMYNCFLKKKVSRRKNERTSSKRYAFSIKQMITPYEYGSDMQYASDAFADHGNSIIPLNPKYLRTLGSQTISFYDIRMINWHYKCNGRFCSPERAKRRMCRFPVVSLSNVSAPCAGIGANCTNGGAPNPRNCSVCICPFGYDSPTIPHETLNRRLHSTKEVVEKLTTGEFQRAGCGRTLAATRNWKSRTVTLGDARTMVIRDIYTMCNDWITVTFQLQTLVSIEIAQLVAPAGKKIQVQVTALRNVDCENGCWRSSIEPKVIADKAMTSPRICCPGQLYQVLTSHVNPTPVVTYSIQHASTFIYQYRYI
ncbi:astacin [Cooperia oncophora]